MSNSLIIDYSIYAKTIKSLTREDNLTMNT